MAKSTKRTVKKNVARGIVHIKASFNNTHVTITGIGTRATPSPGVPPGAVGFKGTRKSTPYAAQRAAERAAGGHAARDEGGRVRVKGVGSGRESAVRALSNSGLKVTSIEDVTPLPHNGCRARKRRRV